MDTTKCDRLSGLLAASIGYDSGSCTSNYFGSAIPQATEGEQRGLLYAAQTDVRLWARRGVLLNPCQGMVTAALVETGEEGPGIAAE
jgi:hypothetical protein